MHHCVGSSMQLYLYSSICTVVSIQLYLYNPSCIDIKNAFEVLVIKQYLLNVEGIMQKYSTVLL